MRVCVALVLRCEACRPRPAEFMVVNNINGDFIVPRCAARADQENRDRRANDN